MFQSQAGSNGLGWDPGIAPRSNNAVWRGLPDPGIFDDFPPAPVVPAQSQTPPPQSVSTDRLRHPLSSKAVRMIDAAMKLAHAGDHPAAIAGLQAALVRQPSSAPYVHSLLGVEFMRLGDVPRGAVELEEAVNMFPHEAINHSNFALSLMELRQFDRAEKEARRALELDSGSAPAKTILQDLLEQRKSVLQRSPSSDSGAVSGAASGGQ